MSLSNLCTLVLASDVLLLAHYRRFRSLSVIPEILCSLVRTSFTDFFSPTRRSAVRARDSEPLWVAPARATTVETVTLCEKPWRVAGASTSASDMCTRVVDATDLLEGLLLTLGTRERDSGAREKNTAVPGVMGDSGGLGRPVVTKVTLNRASST